MIDPLSLPKINPPLLSVVIPCLNEEASLEILEDELFEALRGLKIPFEVLFVNDGSTDKTALVLSSLTSRRPEVRVLTHPTTQGMGAALRTGLKAALGEFTATIDADLSFHPRQLSQLLSHLQQGGFDCVIGSPFLGIVPKPDSAPWRRRWLSRSANRVYQVLLGGFTAATTIFRIYKTGVTQRMRLCSTGFTVNAEALFLMIRADANVAEIPAELARRRAGYSKLKVLPVVLAHLSLMAEILLWKAHRRRPAETAPGLR